MESAEAEKGKGEDTIDPKQVPWWCSSRLGLAFIGFFGFVNLYALRVNMSVAMVCMVNQTAIRLSRQALPVSQVVVTGATPDAGTYNFTGVSTTETNHETQRCGTLYAQNTTHEDGELVWSKKTQGLVLGSFFWGYLVTQIPGGWLSGIFGGKRVFGWFMFMTAVATLLMPVAARASYIFLIILRILAGIGQGVVWPAMHAIWAYWSPPIERSKLIGFTFAGAQLGNVITLPLAAVLCDYGFDGGWPSVFYVLGTLGVVWFIAWMIIAYDTPEQHPRISPLERKYIQQSLIGQMSKTQESNVRLPWKMFFTSGPVWAIIITHTCANWGTYTFLTNMPTYMKEVLKFDIKSNGLYSAIPYIAMWLMVNLSGFLADALRSREIVNTTVARKIFNTAGLVVPAIVCVILGFIDCTQPTAGVALLTIGVSFIGCLYGAGFVVNHGDIAPRYAGVLFGISNTAATIPGFLAPIAIGSITSNQTQAEWQTVFYITAVISLFGAFIYLIFGSGELQPWAVRLDPKEEVVDVPLGEIQGKEVSTNQC